MDIGKLPANKLGENGVNVAQEYAAWLFQNPRTLEVWGAINAVLLEAGCTARSAIDGEMEYQEQEFDSGTWLLVRVADIPGPTDDGGIMSFKKTVD